MKNFDLASMGVHEMSTLEMKETDGGIVVLLIVAGLLLLGAASCSSNVNIQIGGQNNTGTQEAKTEADSSLKGNTLKNGI